MPLTFKYYYGTIEGGKRAAKTNIRLYGKDFYREMGRKGGSTCWVAKGFGSNPELAKRAGRLGGLVSRRGKPNMPLALRRKLAKRKLKREMGE